MRDPVMLRRGRSYGPQPRQAPCGPVEADDPPGEGVRPVPPPGGRYDPGVTEPHRPPLVLDRLEAVVFDTDGVLTDTAGGHAAAWKRLFDGYLQRRAARGGEPFRAFTETDYLRHGFAHLRDHGAHAFPTSVMFVRRLRAEGLRTAAVSASRNMVAVLASAGLRGQFDVEVDGVEADRLGLAGKPDPALFLEAARRLAVAPARAAVVEDALAERGADLVVADPEELALDGGPGRRGGP